MSASANVSYLPSPVSRDRESQHAFHLSLSAFNARRLTPGLPENSVAGLPDDDLRSHTQEMYFVEGQRQGVRSLTGNVPTHPKAFVRWFEELREHGPGQQDPLFAWLATTASMEQMRWFLTQEAAGEAGFDDLVALTQVRFPDRAKLEMARNYWDEMGRGHARGMHAHMLANAVRELELQPTPERTVWQSLALSNLMIALAVNRRYAYHSVGALGVIEMTAPKRVAQVNDGLRRLGVSAMGRQYFQLHAGLDIQHSEAWNREVLETLVDEKPAVAVAIAEGALMRLKCGERCFHRYREHLFAERAA